MRDPRGLAAMDDLALLACATLAFSLFFASLAGSLVAREADARSDHLRELADRLLAGMMDDARWTAGHGLLLAARLDETRTGDVAGPAEGHPFRVVVRDLATGARWTFGGDLTGDRRTSAGAANVAGGTVDPARIVATVGA